MIVVTVQYRLGVLGFLKIDSLGLTGNYGFKDVIMALSSSSPLFTAAPTKLTLLLAAFIKKEIVAFGGSSKVTLAGHSSGAEMIKALLVTPSAVSLFSRAILHSAPLNYADQSPSIANAIGTSILGPGGLNCTNLGCLQRQPVQNILDAQLSLFDPSTSIYAGYVQGASTVTPIRTVVDGSLVTRAFGAVTQEQGAIEGVGKQIIFTTMKDEACDAIGQLCVVSLTRSTVRRARLNLASQDAERAAGSVLPFDCDAALWTSCGAYSMVEVVPARNGAGCDEGGAGAAFDRLWLVSSPPPLLLFAGGLKFLTFSTNRTCANQQSAVNISQNAIAKPIVYLAQFSIGISYSNSSVPSCVGEASHQYVLFLSSP